MAYNIILRVPPRGGGVFTLTPIDFLLLLSAVLVLITGMCNSFYQACISVKLKLPPRIMNISRNAALQ
jgi:hypothetical protein